MKNKKDQIALFTLAVGKDPVYFDSVHRYFPYNKEYFGEGKEVDYLLFTDRNETIDGIKSIPCFSSLWSYTTLLKNNMSHFFDKLIDLYNNQITPVNTFIKTIYNL